MPIQLNCSYVFVVRTLKLDMLSTNSLNKKKKRCDISVQTEEMTHHFVFKVFEFISVECEPPLFPVLQKMCSSVNYHLRVQTLNHVSM